MENNILRQFSANYKQIIIDEIALEGLEGIGLDLLWRRIEKRLGTHLTEKMRARYWNFIVNNNKLSFYELPEPFAHLDILDRFSFVDEVTGHLLEPPVYLDGPYEYKPVDNEYGSCRFYDTRRTVPNIKCIPYEKVISQYGDKLAIVAGLEERWEALASHMPMLYLNQMQPINYCLLELIGRARGNGQMTVGKSNLHNTISDSKTLFYNRKQLQDWDLIRIQNVSQILGKRSVKCLLISLKRFFRPGVLCIPYSGMLRNVVDYLIDAPNQRERTDILIKKKLLTQKQNKRLQKTVNIFSFEDKLLTTEKSKSKKGSQKRKYIYLSARDAEVSDSEEDNNEVSLKCQYKIGIGLLRQAYEQFLNAGLKGLTQVQLSQLLGIEFYTSRAICRIFRLKKIVREYLEDKGKQRTARFIAVVATENMEKSYEEQKNTFSEFTKHIKKDEEKVLIPETTEDFTSDEPPKKKIKIEKDSPQPKSKEEVSDTFSVAENGITEIKVIDGFEKAKTLGSFRKNPTLRQLKFANGILKVLNEKLCLSGYMTLSSLASKEVNEPPMDTKALKSFLQKLVTDGHIKMYKIKWPGLQRYSVLTCAHHIQINDPIVKAKYKEICMRAAVSIQINTKKEIIEGTNTTSAELRRTYPRYMKIRKLHEFIMNIAYFDFVKPESHSLPQGFVCVIDLFPEAKIEFLINNLCTSTAAEMYPLITDDQLQLKLKDATPTIYKALMKSKKVQNYIRTNLKVLGMLGLVQLVSHQTAVTNNTGSSNFSSFLFYVNRNAKILDTSGVWPRSKGNVKELSYHFETASDVEKYWTDVYNISTNTEIMLSERGRKQLLPPLRKANDVQIYDNGARYGDGSGPCGFDSSFYMEMPRLWQTFFSKPIIPKKTIVVKKPKFEPVKKLKRKTKKQSKKRVIERPPQPKELPLKRRRPDNSVKWSRDEDLIITICKAAITIMSPSSQPGSLIVRNVVAKDLLSIKDPRKTKGLCHSRASTIDSNITMIHEKQCIINEMRRRRNITQKYEGLLKKLRLKFSTNMSKFINKARIPMLELVWIILKVIKTKSYTQRMPCVAINLQDFHAHFTITNSTANKLCNMYKMNENSALKEAIIVVVIQTLESELNTQTSKKIYAILQQYPETALRSAVEQLRKCSAIAAKEKLFNNQHRKLDLEDITQSSYKISVSYTRRWICRLNADFGEKLARIIENVEFENSIRGSAEMNCVVCELGTCGIIEVESTAVPIIADKKGNKITPGEMRALTIDTKFSLKTGKMTLHKKKNVKISELYKFKDFKVAIDQISRSGTFNKSDLRKIKPNMKDKLVCYLNEKQEKGATYSELLNCLGYDEKTLIDKLHKLESEKVIARVGFYENVIILTEHVKSWSTEMENKFVICTPWFKFTTGINIDVFIKWTSVVMNMIFEKPGCSFAYISEKLEFITYRAVQEICMFLEKNQCLTLNIVQVTQPDLFSNEDNEPKFIDFNPFHAPEYMLAYPTNNCMTRYSYLRKTITNYYSA